MTVRHFLSAALCTTSFTRLLLLLLMLMVLLKTAGLDLSFSVSVQLHVLHSINCLFSALLPFYRTPLLLSVTFPSDCISHLLLLLPQEEQHQFQYQK